MRCPVLKVSAILLGAKQRFNKERFQLAENLRSARCSPFVLFKVLAARMTKLISARVRKNKPTARMLASARKNHLIPLNKTGNTTLLYLWFKTSIHCLVNGNSI